MGLYPRLTLKWYGSSGMHWDQLDGCVDRLLKCNPPPSHLLIQLGSNDLVSMLQKDIISNMTCSVLRLRALLPRLTIIWSDILPRLYWHKARNPAKVDKSRKRINSALRSLVLMEGGRIIRHPNIMVGNTDLYRYDGVHLSKVGNAIYLNNIQGAFESFISGNVRVFPQI